MSPSNMGFGGGFGRGFGRRSRFYAAGLTGRRRGGMSELDALRAQSESLEESLKIIRVRIAALDQAAKA
jgi:hypothetical protein